VESPTVATCPSEGARRETRSCVFQGKKNAWSHHQCLFEENVGKTKMEKVEGLRILKMRVRELFTHGEGISTPSARHKGRQPLIECANHDYVFSLFMLSFSLFMFFNFCSFFMFFTFLGSTRVFSSLLRIPQLR